MDLLWPKIHDYATAKSAANHAAAAAFFIVGVSGAVASLTIVLDHPILGIDERAFWDVAIFALVGWGIRKGSRIAAVVGLLICLLEAAQRYVARPGSTPAAGLIVTVFLILHFLHGVRGTFSLQRLASEEQRGQTTTASAR